MCHYMLKPMRHAALEYMNQCRGPCDVKNSRAPEVGIIGSATAEFSMLQLPLGLYAA